MIVMKIFPRSESWYSQSLGLWVAEVDGTDKESLLIIIIVIGLYDSTIHCLLTMINVWNPEIHILHTLPSSILQEHHQWKYQFPEIWWSTNTRKKSHWTNIHFYTNFFCLEHNRSNDTESITKETTLDQHQGPTENSLVTEGRLHGEFTLIMISRPNLIRLQHPGPYGSAVYQAIKIWSSRCFPRSGRGLRI